MPCDVYGADSVNLTESKIFNFFCEKQTVKIYFTNSTDFGLQNVHVYRNFTEMQQSVRQAFQTSHLELLNWSGNVIWHAVLWSSMGSTFMTPRIIKSFLIQIMDAR